MRLEIEGSADNGEAEPARALARVFVLPGGLHLLAGRDVRELESTRTLIGRTLGWGLGLTVLLALAGGVAMSRGSARRIETIRQTGQEIIDGDLSRRIARDHTGDDFDQLAAHLNHMLDRIEILMSGVREVSDNIAHDLRTPLARLRGQLEQLRSEPDSARSQVETAIAEADALLATFNGLLRIARVESGGEGRIRRHRPTTSGSGCRRAIRTASRASPPAIRGDFRRLPGTDPGRSPSVVPVTRESVGQRDQIHPCGGEDPDRVGARRVRGRGAGDRDRHRTGDRAHLP